LVFLFAMFFALSSPSMAQYLGHGINLTGMERTWESPRFRSKEVIAQIKELKAIGYSSVRIPLAVDFLLEHDRSFLRELRKVVRYAEGQQLTLILAYFDHQLDEEKLGPQVQRLQENWVTVLKSFDEHTAQVYLELANEPQLSPNTWYSIVPDLVAAIRKVNPDIPVIVGATNYNSLFELSRMEPWPLDRIIFTFHYYEPYLFTHQGTPWTGPQNSTLGVPYPYEENWMPPLADLAKGTSGEINYRDYSLTGNRIAMEDKIGQISLWAKRHGVELWCTEYGVTFNSDPDSRKNYLLDLSQVLQNHGIPGFVWEWEGNFGIKELLPQFR